MDKLTLEEKIKAAAADWDCPRDGNRKHDCRICPLYKNIYGAATLCDVLTDVRDALDLGGKANENKN